MSNPYETQALILTPLCALLFFLYVYQTYVAVVKYEQKEARKKKANQSGSYDVDGDDHQPKTPRSRGGNKKERSTLSTLYRMFIPKQWRAVKVLEHFRKISLLTGLFNGVVMVLYTIDSGRVNGVWNDIIITNLFGKMLTCSCILLVSSYVTAVTSASYTATQLNQRKSDFVFRLVAWNALLLALVSLVTTLVSAASSIDEKYTFAPYLVLTVIAEVFLIVAFDIAYFPFLRAVQDLRSNPIRRACQDMRRVFIMAHVFGAIAPPYQIWYTATQLDEHHTDHDPNDFEIKDQFDLYFVFLVTVGGLYVIWQKIGPSPPAGSSSRNVTRAELDTKPTSTHSIDVDGTSARSLMTEDTDSVGGHTDAGTNFAKHSRSQTADSILDNTTAA